MRLQYASDLHLEFRANSEYLREHPLSVSGDFLILAGDTLILEEKKLLAHPFLDWCADNYEHTFLVPGNHEYYSGCELLDYFDDLEMHLRTNVTLINNRAMILGSTELFFTTLWSVVPQNELMPVQIGLTDCRRIVYNGRRFTSQDYGCLHSKCLSWLKRSVHESHSDKKVVVSHHCPTRRFVDPRFIESNIQSAFCVDLDSHIEHLGVDKWIFGHTHYNGGTGERIGNTVMLTNQLGYVQYGENSSFVDNASIFL